MTAAPQHPMADVMFEAWMGFVSFAHGEPRICERFASETGYAARPATEPAARMVEAATGYGADRALAFAIWVTREIWGWEFAPTALRKEAEGHPLAPRAEGPAVAS